MEDVKKGNPPTELRESGHSVEEIERTFLDAGATVQRTVSGASECLRIGLGSDMPEIRVESQPSGGAGWLFDEGGLFTLARLIRSSRVARWELQRQQRSADRLAAAIRCCGSRVVLVDAEGRPCERSTAWEDALASHPDVSGALTELCVDSLDDSRRELSMGAGRVLVREPLLDARGARIGALVRFELDPGAAAPNGSSSVRAAFDRATVSLAASLRRRGIPFESRATESMPDFEGDFAAFEAEVYEEALEAAASVQPGDRVILDLACDPEPCVDVWRAAAPGSVRRVHLRVVNVGR